MWSLSFALILALIAASFVSGSAQETNPDVAQIARQLRESKNQEALELANQALAKNPNSCRLLTLKGAALVQLQQPDPANDSFSRALTLCPRYLPALEGAAQVKYALRQPGTTEILKRIIAIDPENITAHAMLAALHLAEGDCESAMSHFEASQQLFSTRGDLEEEYASCLAEQGDYDKALSLCLELSAARPSHSIEYSVAFLQWRLHASNDALKSLSPLLLDKYEPAYYLGARILEEQGNTGRAVELLQAAILLDPKDVDNYLEFANIAFAHGSFKTGIDVLNAGIARLPDSAPLRIARGTLEIQEGQNDRAVGDFEQAHRLDPKLSLATDAIGIVKTQEQGNPKALAFFQLQARLNPSDAFLQFLLAEQYADAVSVSGQSAVKDAIAAASASVRLDPTYTAAHDLLARLYVQSHQWNLVIRQAKVALSQNPNDEPALYQEILAVRASGDHERAALLTERLKGLRQEKALRRRAAGQRGDEYPMGAVQDRK